MSKPVLISWVNLLRTARNKSCVTISDASKRYICKTPQLKNYEGDGKTTLTILNHELDSPLMVDGYHQNGFRLNNGFAVVGPMALFPKTVLAWDVGSSEQINAGSLALFALLEPKLDILVIGIGDSGSKIHPETISFLKKKKINFEILSTEHACTTFNFLNVERRCVAAALIPPRHIRLLEDDIINSKMKRRKSLDEILR